ncbi:hypothetical protein [Pseudoxanthomonas suwonensis]|uniref:Hemin transport protein n=1 Tax=Pseudoxanthomonas suwonensis TaxID=314722 RepID=A0A0E3UMA0_9GAMM|nr:hypothetical protein [Pseudoxanthomonas suwonensis]AKC86156.1 hypothetical protein WQ53_04570 [Pseudoxanthomonas suwonensis]
MARHGPAVGDGSAPVQARPSLPRPRQLAELGSVLCLYRPQRGGELAGWMQAVRAEAATGVDSDGLQESLSFFDDGGQCCWRLFLLPDSDFLAWDMLAAQLPVQCGDAAQGVADRLWRRLAGRLGGNGWRVCALRLHVLAQESHAATLAASPAPLSTLGLAAARRIARQEGAEGEVRLDECCCARAAAGPAQVSPPSGGEVPLVKL